MNKRKLLQSTLVLALAAAASGGLLAQDKPIKVGATAGPHSQILEQVKKVAERDGPEDPDRGVHRLHPAERRARHRRPGRQQLPAQALPGAAGQGPRLQDHRGGLHRQLPIGIYSKKVKSLKDLKEGARFGLPNDPTNGGRVLLVLQDQGLIKLKPGAGLKATPLDVVENPKKLKFVELEAAQLPRSLDDLDASGVNTNYAIPAGLHPGKDAIAQESAKSPYVNLIAVREQDKDKPWVAKLVKAYQSEEVRKFVQTEFKGAVIPGF
jgi:D-methionine transport system substrate-binding protein